MNQRTPNLLQPIRTGATGPLALVLAVLSCTAAARAQGDRGPRESMPAIAIAEGVRIGMPGASSARLRPEPVYLFDDPARTFTKGVIWAWGQPGRPSAIMSAAINHRNTDSPYWLCEMTSLSPGPLSGNVPGGATWTPGPGLVAKPLPDAPAPGGDEPRRSRQMKDLARRFEAYEFYDHKSGESERFQLRLLPQPVLRYADPATGLVDGALFFFVYGRNPEVVLLVESRREGDSGPTWAYGLARVGAARLHVKLDGAEVWQAPRTLRQGANEPYWTFIQPLGPGDREDPGSGSRAP